MLINELLIKKNLVYTIYEPFTMQVLEDSSIRIKPLLTTFLKKYKDQFILYMNDAQKATIFLEKMHWKSG